MTTPSTTPDRAALRQRGFDAVWARLREERWPDVVHNLKALAPLLDDRVQLWEWSIHADVAEVHAGEDWPAEEMKRLYDQTERRILRLPAITRGSRA